ncbi:MULTISPECIES: hypothetical protein [Burkholderia]|uniref:hypothetical protein n=1 Tax=Burkholderia TaxID=32008 RepID=UPI000758CDFD|nr:MULTISPECIES: hypothetical protein [Burkholderia]AOJ72275.1 hypothetical protein WS78_26470 [Burkholderia savannae]KVG44236.1 hypothetical protein WS77_09910 [Burkholderia sp. MSMB0265]KVG87764.1 hypothetical protein WS81_25895 [Burkholderia sp. MSMB2040]KVG96393.1 hypothetical protein WS83_03260 [Burkholderia sp. MSMB2042]KVG97165.1 hypothetical protein WS82_30120 [Burkholderia sp. MSMB2041]
MSRIQKTISDLAVTRYAEFETKRHGAPIALHDDGTYSMPIQVTIDGHWFSVDDLRHAAKLFNKLADKLESDGRGVTE